MREEDISIRSIQHFLYCAHRWGLLEIDCAWAENVFVTRANLIHSRVHDEKNSYSSYGKKAYTAVSVYNDSPEYNLYGVVDCLEVKDDTLCIVEYKPTKPKNDDYNYDDLMQVFAQKICVDNVFDCDCEGVLYYSDTKTRVKLPLKQNFSEYDDLLKSTLSDMRKYLKTGEIPVVNSTKNCSGCSIKDICMPSLKKKKDVKKSIYEMLENGI